MPLEKLLSAKGMRITSTRKGVLNAFEKSSCAMSHGELESVIGESVDRVTLYRTLDLFEAKGILHRVVDKQGVVRYSRCKHDCSEAEHHDTHLHFQCEVCDQVSCLPQVQIARPTIPQPYQINDWYMIATGVCASCSE